MFMPWDSRYFLYISLVKITYIPKENVEKTPGVNVLTRYIDHSTNRLYNGSKDLTTKSRKISKSLRI